MSSKIITKHYIKYILSNLIIISIIFFITYLVCAEMGEGEGEGEERGGRSREEEKRNGGEKH